MPWVYDPHSGGKKFPERAKIELKNRIIKYAEKYSEKFTRLDIRFRNQFCYVDAYTEPDKPDKRLLELRN